MAKNGLAWNKGIKTGISSKRIDIEKELLISLYYGNHYTLQEIGNLFGCTKSCIMSCMKRQNIPRRDASESRIGVTSGKNHPMYGKHHTKESREKMSKSRMGVSLNHKTNCQCGVCKTKRGETFGVNHNFYGRHHTEETKQLISKNRSGKLTGSEHPMWKGGKKVAWARSKKRRGKLKFIPLFLNPFPDDIDVDYHHINNLFVVPIPSQIHKKCGSGRKVDLHREKCNLWLYYLYGIDFGLLIGGNR